MKLQDRMVSVYLSLSSIRNSGMLGYGVTPPRVIVFRVVLIVLASLMGGINVVWQRLPSSLVECCRCWKNISTAMMYVCVY